MRETFRLMGLVIGMGMLLLLVASYVLAQAPGGGIICYGWHSADPNDRAAVTGVITDDESQQTWRFTGRADTAIQIVMEATDGNLDPFVFITEESTGERIVSGSSNVLDGRRLVILRTWITSDGAFVITASRLGESVGTSTGQYRLTLEEVAFFRLRSWDGSAAEFHANIYDGNIVSNVISGPRRVHAWYFTSRAGDIINIRWNATNGGEFTNGEQKLHIGWVNTESDRWDTIEADISASGSQIQLVNYRLENAGEYVIVLEAEDSTIPAYSLSMTGSGGPRPEPPPCGDPLPQCPAESPLGTPAVQLLDSVSQSDGITASVPIVPYQFVAFSGNEVTITMRRTGGDLDTFLGLLDVDGNVVARDESADPEISTIESFPIPDDGCYFVYASREGVNDGTTEGTFTIIATGIPQGDETPQPPRDMVFGGDVEDGETVSETISSTDWQVVYRFQGDGETYRVTATRLNGDLRPALTLLDADYNELDSVSANFAGNASNPLVFDTVDGDYYFIVVQREGGESGTTSGDFTLTLSQ